MAVFQFMLTPDRGMGKHKLFIWKQRVVLTLISAFCIVILDLIIPQKALNQPIYPSSITQKLPPQQNSFKLAVRFQGKTIRQAKLSGQDKVIALTFDDGPSPNITPKVLSILQEKHIKATFFLIGKNLKRFPEIGRQVAADGHAIGNHTWHHWSYLMSDFTAAYEISHTASLIRDITRIKTELFRPPQGYLHNGLADNARKQKNVVVLWSVDSGDWRKHGISVEKLVNKVLKEAQAGAIVLMHDRNDCSLTVQALPKIIDELKERGYTFVSVPELLQMQDQELIAGT